MAEKNHTLFVCVTCNPNQEPPSADGVCAPREVTEDGLGNRMYQSVKALVEADAGLAEQLNVKSVKCMCNCNRPCSIGFAGENKNTLLFADARLELAEDVVSFARLFVNNPIGTTPKDKRPASMRGTMIARIPPYTFTRK